MVASKRHHVGATRAVVPVVLAGSMLATSCVGGIGGQPGSEAVEPGAPQDPSTPQTARIPQAPGTSVAVPPADTVPAAQKSFGPRGAGRLSRAEHLNTLNDLLQVTLTADL